jgi:hypothetical protein
MSWRTLFVLCCALGLSACGGDSAEEEQKEESVGQKFDRALEDAKKKLEETLDSGEQSN